MTIVLQDLRYGLRMMLRNKGFTLIAVLSLALGIGANSAIFSLVNAVLLKPLAFHDPDRLVMVWEDQSSIGFPQDTPAPGNYSDWKAQNQVFEDMAAQDFRNFNITGDGEPEKVTAYGLTANFFPLLGARPTLGRAFSADDDKPEATKVVILSYRLWQSRYGGDRDIIGKKVALNDESYDVIGVMPASFQFLDAYTGLWVPIRLSQKELANRDNHYLNVIARMKEGVTLDQAQADLKGITERIARDYPDEAENLGVAVVPMREQLAGAVRRPLIVLLFAVAFVLLIACANTANLLLSRAASRRREVAIRTALGASRWRITRQLLVESLLLAGAGGILGLLLAEWSFAFLQQLIPGSMRLTTRLTIDARVLGFTLFVSFLTGIVFGIVPALQASKSNIQEALKHAGGRTTRGAGHPKLKNVLIIAEVALSLVLLVGAGLLIQTFYHLRSQYSGLRPENLLTLRTNLLSPKYTEHAKRVAFYDEVLERVKHLPGVISAGYTTTVPLEWKGGANGLSIEGKQPEPGVLYNANHRQVSADYLQTMAIALAAGRYFNNSDQAQSQAVVIVNETLANQYFPGENALGKRLKVGNADSPRPWLTIVGIVKDVRQMGLEAPVKAEIYLPYRQTNYQAFFTPRDLVVRTSVEPLSLASAVRGEIQAVDPNQPVSNIRTMDEILGEETLQRRLGMTLLVTFAGLALVLAAIGIYGVMSYFVVQHTPEIGVRMALGARSLDILKMVISRGMSLVLAGTGVGILIAVAVSRLIKSLLFGVSETDPLTLALVAAVLSGVALVACLVPARRATKTDPMIALRNE